MALNIAKVCSADSFLLTFSPLQGSIRDPFHILLDPVLVEPATNNLLHHPPSKHIPSISHLPTPDLVIVSQSRITPPLEAALRHIALTTTKTIILAQPATAKTLRAWKNFDISIVGALSPWLDPRLVGEDRVVRVPVPPCYIGGDRGEVTVALIPQRGFMKGARAAIGITYRPSPSRPSPFRRCVTMPVTTPGPIMSAPPPQLLPCLPVPCIGDLTARLVPPTPPLTPKLPQPPPKDTDTGLPLPRFPGKTLSVIFSPRGTSYNSIKPYATSHLVTEAALPLTALIHSFDTEPKPLLALRRNISYFPIGQETALALGARAWIATCGSDDKVTVKNRRPRTRTYLWHEVQEMLDRAEARERRASSSRYAPRSTHILDLYQGEEVTLTSDGVCELDPLSQHQRAVPDALGVLNSVSAF
ncbi:hypothetical protein THARTR1_05610 [Trichoderma harzianum]|uniref:Uncharacterized protein n=1 Tax=Trichoderma harzianum TaxID=5544 RepID=A0A2K0U821_TRIHA|nr:hypothetical protein THARTR1_05610 [Trichoderma harzianum]